MITHRGIGIVKSLMNSTAVRVGAVIFFRVRNPTEGERFCRDTGQNKKSKT